MKTALIIFWLIICLACTLSGQDRAAARSVTLTDTQIASIREGVQAKLDRAMANGKIAGATVGFALPDGRSFSVSSGVSNLQDKRKLLTTDPILAGSIGKTFVSALALQLVETGRLDLDEKIGHWLAGKPWFARLPNAHEITVRMLMNHSSGIPNHVEGKIFEKAALKGALRDVAFDDLLTFVLDKKPLFAAGRGFYYADTNYILLAMIEEAITGTTMYQEVADRFLKPLKLDHTAPSNKNGLPAVYGYYEGQPVVKDGHILINPQWEWAGGGFTSTSEDLARWAKNLYAGPVLKKSTIDEMLKSVSTGDGANYGLGVEILRGKWGVSYGHDGEYPGYLSVMRYYPKYDVAFAAQINVDGTPEANGFINAAADDFAAFIIGELVDRRPTDAEKASFQTIAETWLHLIDTGRYTDSWNGVSAELKTKYTQAAWPAALEPFIKKAGQFKQRQLKSVIFSEPAVVAIDFDSKFSKLSAATETVFLKQEADGKWRVSSYSIH